MIFRLRTQQKQLLVKRNWKAAQKFSYFEVYGVIRKISRSKPFAHLLYTMNYYALSTKAFYSIVAVPERISRDTKQDA